MISNVGNSDINIEGVKSSRVKQFLTIFHFHVVLVYNIKLFLYASFRIKQIHIIIVLLLRKTQQNPLLKSA